MLNKSQEVKKQVDYFLQYYSIILNNSIISINRYIDLNTSYHNLVKNQQLLFNLSCNFLDSSFVKLVHGNENVIGRLFSFIIYNSLVFMDYSSSLSLYLDYGNSKESNKENKSKSNKKRKYNKVTIYI